MADKIETIQILFQKRNARSRGSLSSAQYNDNMNELSHDLVSFVEQWNNRLVPLTGSLPNRSGSDLLDAFADGLDGKTIYVNDESTALNDSRYFDSDTNRPSSIYEKFDDLYDSIEALEADLEGQISAFAVNALQVPIADEGSLYTSQNVEQALAEAMTAINSLTVGTFDPSSISVHMRPASDNTYTLGTSARRWADLFLGPDSLYIKSIAGDTVFSVDKTYTIGINTETGVSTGQLEIKEGGNTLIRLSSTGVSFPMGITSSLNDLTDVTTAGLVNRYALVYNSTGTQWEPQAIPRLISDLEDSNISSPNNGDLMVFNGVDWENSVYTLGDLFGTTIASTQTGHLLKYTGAAWENTFAALAELSDVSVVGASVDDALIYNGASWSPVAIPRALTDLSDATILTPVDGNFLWYDSGQWVNTNPVMSHLTDVDLTGLSVNEGLVWEGTEFVPRFLPSGLDDLFDVDVSSPSNGQVLKYNSGTWEPTDDEEGITGSAAINQVSFWLGTDSVSGDSDFVWDISTSKLGIHSATPNERLTLNGILSLGAQSTPSLTAGYTKLWLDNTTSGIHLLTSLGSESAVAQVSLTADVDSGDLVFFDDDGLITTSSGLNWDEANQSLVIGSDSSDPDIGLEITKEAGPILLPRMTQAEIDALAGVEGIMVYNLTSGIFQGYSSTGWVAFH